MVSPKVLTPAELKDRLAELKGRGKKVVTTNGCFDVLHVGHLRYLQAAKGVGDVLVVLLNSDASVKSIKGPARPIVPQEERAELLSGLECVDYVTLFDESSPASMLVCLGPDFHVKGGDYSAETLPEAQALQSVGTELVFIPMIEGRSTTSIIQRILEGQSSASCNPSMP